MPHPSDAPAPPGAGATVNQWLEYLEAIHPLDIDLGLDRVMVVFRRLFRRNPGARIITVAGTNGKGSTVAALDVLLTAAGRRAGTYTSPHLQRYNERVRIEGEEVSDDALVAAFAAVEQARGKVSLTYFEFGTLAAFVLLERAGIDDWVLEVGLGGRLDAVNVLDPDLAIITSVDIDHVAFLGNDRETIGFEKAGILRPGIPAIYADLDPPDSVLQQANAQRVKLLRPGQGYHLTLSNTAPGLAELAVEGNPDRIDIPTGGLPMHSLAAAAVATRILQPDLSAGTIAQALAGVTLSGRFEYLGRNPAVIADVGHNPHASRWLARRVTELRRPGQRVLGVYGALADKDIEGVLEAMAAAVDQWFFGGLDVPRGLSGPAIAERSVGSVPPGQAAAYDSIDEALTAAMSKAREQDLLIVFGSFSRWRRRGKGFLTPRQIDLKSWTFPLSDFEF